MSEPIKVKYSDIEITYIEKTNRWNFIVRGRERNAESLEAAKKSIDRPEPKEKTFPRTKAYFCPYGGDPEVVEVTSVAANDRFSGGLYFWVARSGKRQRREKVSQGDLCEFSAINTERVAEYDRLNKEIEVLTEQQQEVKISFRPFKVPE